MMDRSEARKREMKRNIEFQQLDRQSKQIDSQISRNKQQLRKIEKAEQIFTDIHFRKETQLETLSHTWKGQHANSVLAESMSNHMQFQRQQMHQIHERKREVTQLNRALLQKQDEIVKAKRLSVRGGK